METGGGDGGTKSIPFGALLAGGRALSLSAPGKNPIAINSVAAGSGLPESFCPSASPMSGSKAEYLASSVHEIPHEGKQRFEFTWDFGGRRKKVSALRMRGYHPPAARV